MKRTMIRNLIIMVKPLARHQLSVTVTDQETGLVAVAVWDYYTSLFKVLKHPEILTDRPADDLELSDIQDDVIDAIAEADDASDVDDSDDELDTQEEEDSDHD